MRFLLGVALALAVGCSSSPWAVRVQSSPVGAAVTVDNAPRGVTPLELEVSEDATILVAAPGYMTARLYLSEKSSPFLFMGAERRRVYNVRLRKDPTR